MAGRSGLEAILKMAWTWLVHWLQGGLPARGGGEGKGGEPFMRTVCINDGIADVQGNRVAGRGGGGSTSPMHQFYGAFYAPEPNGECVGGERVAPNL